MSRASLIRRGPAGVQSSKTTGLNKWWRVLVPPRSEDRQGRAQPAVESGGFSGKNPSRGAARRLRCYAATTQSRVARHRRSAVTRASALRYCPLPSLRCLLCLPSAARRRRGQLPALVPRRCAELAAVTGGHKGRREHRNTSRATTGDAVGPLARGKASSRGTRRAGMDPAQGHLRHLDLYSEHHRFPGEEAVWRGRGRAVS